MSSPPASCRNFVDVARLWATESPDRRAYTFLLDGEQQEQTVTCAQLDRKVRSIAARLQSLGLAGQPVLLLHPPGIEYVASFLGCLYAGVTAVPAYPPDLSRLERSLPRLRAVAEDAGAAAVLTVAALQQMSEGFTSLAPELAALPWLASDEVDESIADDWKAPTIAGSDLAFLQYTSGSTGTPRGVMVTHGSLFHNAGISDGCFGHSTSSSAVVWLPPYHDMGLIGGILSPMYGGFPCTLMSPLDFLQKPARWLRAISRYRGTTTGAPNFGYDLCVRKIRPAEIEGIDLSSWDLAFNGAEPVRPETHERFAAKFAPYGFRAKSLCPCYGLAEATLIVTGGSVRELPRIRRVDPEALKLGMILEEDADDAVAHVSCGPSASDQRVLVVDPKSLKKLSDANVGEVWVSGPSIAAGYWNRDEETRETFHAHLDTGEGPFMRTGDLGYLLAGELYVTGRLKDVVIIRGRNHYPADIERTAEAAHPAVRGGCTAAFAVDAGGREQLVLVAEVSLPPNTPELADVEEAIRNAIAEGHDVLPHAVLLLKQRTIPKTSSGKIQRFACRAAYVEGTLDLMYRTPFDRVPKEVASDEVLPRYITKVPPPPPHASKDESPDPAMQEKLRAIVQDVLGVDQVGIDESFHDLGLQSLLAANLASRVREAFSVDLRLLALFDHPTIATLTREIARLPVLAPSAASTALAPAVLSPADRHAPFPLTEVQQAYWVGRSGSFALGQVGSHIYVEYDAGDLDVGRLQAAWRLLIERHEMLRATVLEDGTQRVMPEVPPFEIEVMDLRGHSPADAAIQLEATRVRMSHQLFDSGSYPQFELTVTRVGTHASRFHLSIDFLLVDAWSLQLLAAELAELYLSPEKELAPLGISFRDYVLAENASRESPAFQRALEYWRGRLATLPPAPALPLFRAPESIVRPRFQRLSGALDPERLLKLKAHARRLQITPSAVLVAAFSEVLAAWSTEPRFTLNLTLFSRLPVHRDVDRLVGDFTSLTLLEIDGSVETTFAGRCRRVHQQIWTDLEHRQVSGVRVLRELSRARRGAPDAMMPVVFTSLLPLGDRGWDLEAPTRRLGMERVFTISQTPQVWLDHQVMETAGSLVFSWDYVEGLFPPDMLEAMFEAYCGLLARLADDDATWRAEALSFVPRAQLERRAAVNATASPLPDGLLHTPIFERARATPSAVAVIADDRSLTYGELAARAIELGARLRAQGAKPNELVAVVMEKGWEQVVAVLAVHYAGAAYLPISASTPSERLGYLLDNASVRVVLTESRHARLLEWPAGLEVIALDEADWREGDASPPWQDPAQVPGDLAYVIYTSGSTGKPKGVMITHAAALNTVVDVNARFGVRASDRVLALSSLSFDLSVYDVFGALAAGAAIVLPKADELREPARWASLVEEHGVTIWNSVPALMRMFVEYATGRHDVDARSLRLVMMSGDWIPLSLPGAIRALSPSVEIVSLGGATEVSIWSILHRIEQVDPTWTSIPYGRPMVNQTFDVLDAKLASRPDWVPGQLHIGGVGLAEGYLNDEEKTRKSFFVHPITEKRLYRTGDLGRYLPDGNIEILGREDFQVKIRGHRIELGEVESLIAEHVAVQSVVVAASGGRLDRRLVGYIVPRPELSPQQRNTLAAELRLFMEAKAPAHLVPSFFVLLDALPLTSNGKLDRQALPDPEAAGRPLVGDGDDSPKSVMASRPTSLPPPALTTPTQEVVMGLWSHLLARAHVGLDDDFFTLGGDSLLATRLATRIRNAFQLDLPLRAIFENPTLRALAARVDEEVRTSPRALVPPIEPVPRDQDLPLSFAQQRLWFLDQLQPGSAAYNLAAALKLSGELAVAGLRRILQHVVSRHEALRTTFTTRGGEAVQVIHTDWTTDLPLLDLSNHPEGERQARAWELALAEARRPFDLENGPLFRSILVRLASNQHLLVVTIHHIAADGWSLDVLFREILECTSAHVEQRAPRLPELGVQYADFAVWQRSWLTKDLLAEQVKFWVGKLSGVEQAQLPTDRPRPLVRTFNGRIHAFVLPPDLVKGVRAMAKRHGATFFMGLFAAFNVLLHRYSGQTDLVVGTPIANRRRSELEPLVGFFANTLAMRTDLSGHPTFAELLDRVRAACLDAYAHQDVPFERLVDELGVRRDMSQSPLFQVLFILNEIPQRGINLGGLEMEWRGVPTGTAQFDLTLTLYDGPEEILGNFLYAAELFEPSTIARMARHFELLLRGLIEREQSAIDAVSFVSPEELRQEVVEWNATALELAEDRSVHELFEAQVERTPDATAVVFGDAALTYAELDARSTKLGRRLKVLGVGTDVRVGLCVERSLEMVVAVLGVLKAGGAYVPLDPDHPNARLQFMLRDSGAAVLLCGEAQSAFFEEDIPRVIVERALADADATTELGRLSRADPDALAYVIYSSGTTGNPKGIQVPHRTVVNFLESMRRGLDAETVLLAVTTLSFDISVLEILGPLVCGGEVVIASREDVRQGRVSDLIERHGVNVMQATPSGWRLLLAAEWKGAPRLRALSGGEALDKPLAEQLLQRVGTLWNMYGPTETTIWSALSEVDERAYCANGSVSIGRPIGNTHVVLLDDAFGVVPVGVAGELCIGGAGVARGYLERASLTAEKFAPDPFAALLGRQGGARLYRTGDLARYRLDGSIEFVGRRDHQVKVQGYRIELGEIEAVLAEHPRVRECVVVVREIAPADRRLVGYVVLAPERAAGPSLRDHLSAKLPAYMVPSTFVELDALPRSPAGKLDRKALPPPKAELPPVASGHVAPRDGVEAAIVEIWANVLGQQGVGVHDDFFDIGGNSLLATQAVIRMRTVFGIELPLRSLFERPTVKAIAALVEDTLRAGAKAEASPIARVPRSGPLTLSFAQERIWFLEQLSGASATHNMPAILRLRGRLDVEALRRAFEEVARRHEVLRTTFEAEGGQALAIIAEPRRWELVVEDARTLPAEAQPAMIRARAAEDAQRAFDLSRDPMLRTSLIALGEEEHVLLATLHHIAGDGWSIGVLAREAGLLYAAFARGLPSRLPELEIQYVDYAAWQREQLQGEVLDAHLSYWRQRLAGAEALDLPSTRPRGSFVSHVGARFDFEIPADLAAGLRLAGRNANATLFMTLLAAFGAILGRYSGQADLSVGTPIANRMRQEFEQLVGCFVNTLVMRLDLSGDPSFSELIARSRETALGAYVHQDVPFERLVDELGVKRDLARNPLFDVMFVLQSAPESANLPGLEMDFLPIDAGTSKLDLMLSVEDGQGGLRASLEYSTALFDGAAIERMAHHLVVLLRAAIADPAAPISTLPLMSEGERRQVLVEWNDTAEDFPREACIHERFEAQVERTPDAIAVTSVEGSLTYAELDARANQLAHHLRSRGVGTPSSSASGAGSRATECVGLFVERSLEMVVAVLGVLKAGGAYLPLDPEYPPARVALMIEDAGVAIVLTQSRLHDSLPPAAPGRPQPVIVELDAASSSIAAHPTSNPGSHTRPDDLAYVIYTSGSTGRPKGVMCPHRGLVNRLVWMQRRYGLTGNDCVLQKTPFSFDVSVWELLWPLCEGARLVMAAPGGHRDAAYLAKLVRSEAVTVMHFVPSMLATFMAEPSVAQCSSLRHVICSGEALPIALRDAALSTLPGELHNLYGPTEASIDVTSWACDRLRPEVPIGRPIANMRVYVTSPNLEPTPIGVPGELWLGGIGLARGYLGRPALTAERFVPDPFGDGEGARLYRTGDRARHSSDGNVEYLGRLDHQVKLRGHRIELGEVEAALLGYPGVLQCAAVVREVLGDPRLVAYLVTDPGAVVPTARLREHLQNTLPSYMIPGTFVSIDALPLSPSGKLDRRALPDPSVAARSDDHVAPRNPIEAAVSEIWSELLGVAGLGAHDDFFALGGHSLLATRAVSRIRRVFGVELPLRGIFEEPTVGGVAKLLASALAGATFAPALPIPAMPRDGELPLSFAQQRLWFLSQLEPDSAAYNIPAALRLRGELDVEALRRAFEELVRRHEVLRTSFSTSEGRPAQVIEPARAWELPVADLSALSADERERDLQSRLAKEAARVFDLEPSPRRSSQRTSAPMLRTQLLQLAPDEHVALVTMHHIASDGWSVSVMVHELGELYRAFAEGRPSTLPALEIQYADFASWQRQWLTGEVEKSLLHYWRQQLEGAPRMDLPLDRPRRSHRTYRGAHVEIAIPAELTEETRALSRTQGATLFMTLLAAFDLLLQRYCGQDDVSVGTPIANRTRTEVEPLIGFFVNTLVLRTNLSDDPTFAELLKRVRAVALEAYAHQDQPFEQLVEALHVERDLSRNPLFDVMLVVKEAQAERVELPGLTVELLPPSSATAKFDLTLELEDTKDGLRGHLEYNTDLFEEDTARRMARHFEALLRAAVRAPLSPISSLSLFTEPERRRLLVEWNDTAVPLKSDVCIHERIEAQAAKTPDATAVTAGESSLTYAELDSRSNQLAHLLRAHGVGSTSREVEVRVGLYIERSLEMIVGVLAVLKAGGGYVPLDPEYPPARVAFMMEDAGVSVVLTQKKLLHSLPRETRPGHAQPTIIELDATPWPAGSQPTSSPSRRALADDLAYLIYTSGSTGRPKGVMCHHRGLVNRLAWMQQRYLLTPNDCVLQKTPFSFDVSVWELLWPLCEGARLVMAAPGGHRDPAYLAQIIRAEGVTVTHFVPSMLASFLTEPAAARCSTLRHVICSGEALPAAVRDAALTILPGELHNLYGPTEASIDVTSSACDRSRPEVPIGRPIANTQIYVTSPALEPVPIGAAGELWIGGVGLARGYLGRPALTAERFAPDPFGAAGARLYRTGDRARYRPDGNIEYLGRNDHQVKLRGHRIELGEVEAALSTYPGVEQCVAVVRETSGDARLVAYLVTERAAGVEEAGVREHLRASLPSYMIPSLLVRLDALPLTPNGKVDRRALPEPDRARPEAQGAAAPLVGAAQQAIGAIIGEALGLSTVGAEDDFFALGGHSLLAAQVLSRIRASFELELPLRLLFERPTVAGLAAMVEALVVTEVRAAREHPSTDEVDEVVI